MVMVESAFRVPEKPLPVVLAWVAAWVISTS
jgi:hypothetical protein